ncbi:MAG: TIGR00725 family protein [Actinomycetota bacterium]|nr:TIGR00725 family protein [Actinomycetota bacterium]
MSPPAEPPVYVAVCGPGVASAEEEAWAEEVGRLLAREGAVVVCGGMTGVMDAVARGAAEEGGVSIGILPTPDRAGASAHLTYSIPTGLAEARNVLVARAADVLIAISGEFGTLSEIAFALKFGVPVVGLSTWELHRRAQIVQAYPTAATPAEAVREALRLAPGATPS